MIDNDTIGCRLFQKATETTIDFVYLPYIEIESEDVFFEVISDLSDLLERYGFVNQDFKYDTIRPFDSETEPNMVYIMLTISSERAGDKYAIRYAFGGASEMWEHTDIWGF